MSLLINRLIKMDDDMASGSPYQSCASSDSPTLMSGQTPDDPILAEVYRRGAGIFMDVRRLEDGIIVAIGPRLHSMAIYIGMDLFGFDRCYSFDRAAEAIKAYHTLRTGRDVPVGHRSVLHPARSPSWQRSTDS
jgi:hypothetical protein